MAKNIVKTVGPADVREFFNSNPNLVPENDKTVGPKSAGRGRLSKPAREIFAEHNPGTEYAEGTVKNVRTLSYRHVQPSGRTVAKTVDLPVSEIRSLAGEAAKGRGRLTEAALKAAGEAYAEQVRAARGDAAA